MNPSPRTHIYRLLLLLVVLAGAFLGVRSLAIPSSWVSNGWYRGDALTELAQLPIQYGGSESCTQSACHGGKPPPTHQFNHEMLMSGTHKGLACESCHGPLSAHVQDGQKVADAPRESSTELCLNCHRPLLSRPADHAIFSEGFDMHARLQVDETKPCRMCHNAHWPR